VLRSIRASGGLFFRVRMRAPFAVESLPAARVKARFAPDADRIFPFHLVTSGRIWFSVAGRAPVELGPNDVVVLPHGTTHHLADHPQRRPVPVETLEHEISGDPPTLDHGGSGPSCEALCGFFTTRGRVFNPLLDSLPPLLVVRRESKSASWLASTLRKTFIEMARDRPGRDAMVERLTESLFLEVVQSQLETQAVKGWLAGLRDPVVARSLSMLHAAPEHPWTVDALARRSGVSRSVLASRFADSVGRSPMRYLAAWRIELAADRMLESRDGIAEIAASVGYTSEAAFCRAFKRHVGEPPAQWRRARTR